MTSTHDWDAGSVLTLVLGLSATIALFLALVWAIRD
jgi:flagellar biogenesis protein FliO